MSQAGSSEVFTAEEIARAADVPARDVHRLIAAGDLTCLPGTRYIAWPDALRVVRQIRSRHAPVGPARVTREARLPVLASVAVHGVLLAIVLWFSAGPTDTAPAESSAPSTSRLVFIMSPGPGGGGGGGGLRNPLPPPPVERRRTERPLLSVPAAVTRPVARTVRREPTAVPAPPPPPARPEPVVAPPPEPLPSRVLVAPVVSAASDTRDRDGALDETRRTADSQGPGLEDGVGAGQGTGSGAGFGSGIGEGAGGGVGGGPYRPGSGVEPPRLLREVKAEYTEEARRRGVTGDVVLEIVVRSDGAVGAVTVLQGLGAGLDQRAIAAVRQWRFDPARLRGTPVDVLVEVAVEFTLR